MQERSKIVMKEIFEQPLESQNIMAVQDLAEDMVTCILTRQQLLLDRLLIKQTDFQVYVHSVNVAILSLALGRLLKLNDETLLDLGIGAFMHDIGKRSYRKRFLGSRGNSIALNSTYTNSMSLMASDCQNPHGKFQHLQS